MKYLTDYQNEILKRAWKQTHDKDDIVTILLIAIEKRDRLLIEHRQFFGPARRESDKIDKVLETP